MPKKVEDALQLVLEANSQILGCIESKENAQKVLALLVEGKLKY